VSVYFQFPRSPELSRYFRALALRRTHRRQQETPNAWVWGANGRRVSRGRFESGVIKRSGRKLWTFRRRNRGNVAARSSHVADPYSAARAASASARLADGPCEERAHDVRSQIGQSNKRSEVAVAATVEYAQDWPLIWRRDRTPTLTVQSDLVANVLPATVVDALHAKVQALNAEAPVGYTIVPGGRPQRRKTSTRLTGIRTIPP